MDRTRIIALILLLIAGVTGCGGLRFSEVSPDAANFHPAQIAVLPADTAAFPEAKGSVDRLFAAALTEKKWFTRVVGGEQIATRMGNEEELRKTVEAYLARMASLRFSDPALSDRIGSLVGVDAFVIVGVDAWNYTVVDNKKIAKTGISITMVNAKNGKIIWRASHSRITDYLLLKPELPDMAKALIAEMTDHMPH